MNKKGFSYVAAKPLILTKKMCEFKKNSLKWRGEADEGREKRK